jgi:phage pi2 protein 07
VIKSSKNLNPTGTGLGLHNCKNLVEKSGGKIWVEKSKHFTESQRDHGSTFCFTFKIKWDSNDTFPNLE